MKQMLLGLMLPLAGVAGLQAATQPTMQDYTQYVNPFVGTGGHGHVFLGANVPFGHIRSDTKDAGLGLVFRLSLQRFCSCWFRTDAP